MIAEIDPFRYKNYFPCNSNPFLSEGYIELNKHKTERIIYLTENTAKPAIGFLAGINDSILYSPFSAPFGGFNFVSDTVYINEIEDFLESIKEFIVTNNFKGINIILPPDIYHASFNSKLINSLVRTGFHNMIPELTNWVDLNNYNGIFTNESNMQQYRQAVRKGLTFQIADDNAQRIKVHDLICRNRLDLGRRMPITFKELIETSKNWPVEFCEVTTQDGMLVASAIIYRYHPTICYAAYLADDIAFRRMRGMDFLLYNLYDRYKIMGYRYFDLGISSLNGIPNVGLLRFKECHNAVSSIRFGFSWMNESFC